MPYRHYKSEADRVKFKTVGYLQPVLAVSQPTLVDDMAAIGRVMVRADSIMWGKVLMALLWYWYSFLGMMAVATVIIIYLHCLARA